MKAHAGTHPAAEVLRALGTGKLDEAAVEPVLAHLETCHDCQTQLSGISGDSLLARLRAVHDAVKTRSSTPTPLKHAKLDVLAELRNHPQYEVLRELGRGGMGVVYLAKNKLMERAEVLKVVNKQLLGQDGAAERFLREIRSAAKLNHPNIVTAYTTLQVGDLLVLAMEYVEGDDLAKVVKTHGPLPVANACFYMHQAALGLQHASDRGMIHRDIKPGNLILAREGKKHIVKILDFGLAKATREEGTSHDLTGDNQMLGTPDYIAPEQAMDATRADIRADIYSLGCSLHYLLTGSAPFQAHSLYQLLHMHMSVTATPVHEMRPDVPTALSAVVAKMMAKDLAQRYQTPAEAAKALAPFATGSVKALPAERAAAPVFDPRTTISAAPDAKMDDATETAIPTGRRETMVEQRGPLVQVSPHVAAVGLSSALGGRKLLIGAGVGAAMLLVLMLGIMLVVGGVFMLRTKDGTILLENLPPEAVVLVDGEKITLKQAGDGKPIEIQKAPGKHMLEIKRDGFKMQVKEVTLAAGGHREVTLRWEPLAMPEGKADKGNGAPPLAGKIEINELPVTPGPDIVQSAPAARRARGNGLGSWRREGDELVQLTSAFNSRLWFGDPQWTDYDFTFEEKHSVPPSGGAVGASLRSPEVHFGLLTTIDWKWNTWNLELNLKQNHSFGKRGKLYLEKRDWHQFILKVRDQRLECWHDNVKATDCLVPDMPRQGAVCLRTWNFPVRFRNLRVTAPDGKVLWEGLPELGK